MLREVSAPQLRRWMTYDAIEPIGGVREDWNAASISATVMNAAMLIRTGKAKIYFKPKDFLLTFGSAPVEKAEAPPSPPVAPWQTMKMYARMHAALANAPTKRKR